jgi:hypothetical protein
MMLRKFSPKLGVVVLSIVLLTGISLVPTLQIEVQGRGQPQRTTPAISPTPTTPLTSTATTSYTTPQPPRAPPVTTTTTTEEATPAPPVTRAITTTRITPGSTDTANTSPEVDAATGAAVNQTGGEGGAAVNQSAIVMIPLSTMQLLMSQVQDATTAVDGNNKADAMKALNSVDQELKGALDASGVSVKTTTNG